MTQIEKLPKIKKLPKFKNDPTSKMFQPVIVISQFLQKQCYVLRAAGAKDDVRPTFGARLSL